MNETVVTIKDNFQIIKNEHGQWRFKGDADEAKFFDLQLETVKSKIYEAQYATNLFLKYFPVSREADAGDEYVSYTMYDYVGLAKIVANDAEDIETVDIFGQKRMLKLYTIAMAYKYSYDDLWKSAKTNTNLKMRRAEKCRAAIEKKLEKLGWVGDDAWGIKGIVNSPNITFSTVPVGGGGATDWITKTPIEVLGDLNTIHSFMISITEDIYGPNAMFMPHEVLEHLRSTPLDSANGSNVSILQFFLSNHPEYTTVVGTNRLLSVPDEPATGTTNSAIFCRLDPDVISYELPMAFFQGETELRGLVYKIPCLAKAGGVLITHPLTVFNMQNVLD